MTEAKHTPGPWRSHDNPTSNYGLEVVADSAIKAKRVVCRVGGPDRQSNASLIVAAPDMFTVLHECKLQLQYLADKFGETGTGAAVLAKVDAAIARATGAA